MIRLFSVEMPFRTRHSTSKWCGTLNVITNLNDSVAKRYKYNACDTLYDNKQKCDKAWSLCTNTNTTQRSVKVMWYTQKVVLLCKRIFQWSHVRGNCTLTVTCVSKHESFKRFCNYCNKIQTSGHVCYVAPLLASWQTGSCMFSLLRSAHRTLKSTMGPLSIFRNSFSQQICSKCEAVDQFVSNVNIVLSVTMCLGH